jgi:hypothetical protein
MIPAGVQLLLNSAYQDTLLLLLVHEQKRVC